jgi:hypothetical protein
LSEPWRRLIFLGLSIVLEGVAAAPDEDAQAAALLWVFYYRRTELVPMVRRLESLLLDPTVLRISVAAHSDEGRLSALEAYALNAPRPKLRTCWTAVWGTLEAAVEAVIRPSMENRKEAFTCLSFRSDLPSVLSQVAISNHPFYADVLARIKRTVLEHDRLSADMTDTQTGSGRGGRESTLRRRLEGSCSS